MVSWKLFRPGRQLKLLDEDLEINEDYDIDINWSDKEDKNVKVVSKKTKNKRGIIVMLKKNSVAFTCYINF